MLFSVSWLPVLLLVAWQLLFRFYKSSKINGNVLLVTAHPDDESMFFSPAVLHLKPHLVCLSSGDAEGLGRTRAKELALACKQLGITHDLVSDTNLPDSMQLEWDTEIIINHINPIIKSKNISAVLTFDNYGVSGHRNHISLYKALSKLDIKVYALQSTNVLKKFTGILALLDLFYPSADLIFLNSPKMYMTARKAMFQHQSQLEWFRHLYLLCSQYMIVNKFTLVAYFFSSYDESYMLYFFKVFVDILLYLVHLVIRFQQIKLGPRSSAIQI
jgi:N-acetylglucosaminylphosphatidylinositol deacetylase